MSLMSFARQRWVAVSGRQDEARVGFWTFRLTPNRISIWKVLVPLSYRFASGRVLDAGAGTMLYRDLLLQSAREYVSTDAYSTHADLDYHFDLKELGFDDEGFETVFCNQVLEHVDRPWEAIGELARVLAPGGYLIVGIPFYFYIHGIPHDYYRFTDRGMSVLLEDQGLEVVETSSFGGYFGAVLEPLNILIAASGLGIPIWQTLVNLVNFVLLAWPGYTLDRVLKTGRRFPCGYFVIGRKPDSEPDTRSAAGDQ